MKATAHVKTCTIVALGLAACLLAAGCGNLPAPQPRTASGHRVTTAHHAKTGATLAGNRELARKRAAWLLAQLPLPSGAVRLKSTPSSLSLPAMGDPSVQTKVDTVRSWRVPMRFEHMVGWLRAHRPHGLPDTGSSSESDHGRLLMVGFDYDRSAGSVWQSSELEVSVAPAGQKASLLRADGLVVYLDPRPVPDNQKGPRLRVTLAGGCPRRDARIVGVKNQGAGLRHRLLPAGVPLAGLVCRYNGMNGKAYRLRSATRLDVARARRLARSMAREPISHTDGGVVNCPLDDGSAKVIAFVYPHRSDIDLWVTLTGCTYMGNGFILAGPQY